MEQKFKSVQFVPLTCDISVSENLRCTLRSQGSISPRPRSEKSFWNVHCGLIKKEYNILISYD